MAKKICRIIIFFLLIPVVIATQTKNDSNYEITWAIGSGITTNYSDIRVSSMAGEYGIGNYTDNTYKIEIGILYLLLNRTPKNIIEEEEAEEEIEPIAGVGGGSEGARGGGCDVYADTYQKCFYVDLLTSECKEGCLEGYICSDIYRCVIWEDILLLGENKPIDLKLFSNKIQETDILSIGVVLSLILILIFLFGNKLGKKEEEEVEK